MEAIVWGLLGLGMAVGVGFVISGLLHTEEKEREIMDRATSHRTTVGPSSGTRWKWMPGQRSP